ncbi:AMIN-like domain-containing (lipo)protein [Streptomyces hainanensis]|uniref:AMIN-like domain-containing (lipo)protein n=1 Tax=Streptomyces hainanensis TaxID=402648 RepID=UPI001404A143|nr:hypothetical protein [Streptomyces hainanensis]
MIPPRTRRRLAASVAAAALVPTLLAASCEEPRSDTGEGQSEQRSEEPETDTGTGADEPAAVPVGQWDTERKDTAAQGAAQAGSVRLADAAISEHDGYDRLTLTFDEGAPQVIADYVDELPSGDEEPPEVPGAHHLMVVLVGSADDSEVPPVEPTDAVRAVADFGVFEGELRVIVGVDTPGGGAPGYQVTAGENEIVVDIAHEQAE